MPIKFTASIFQKHVLKCWNVMKKNFYKSFKIDTDAKSFQTYYAVC